MKKRILFLLFTLSIMTNYVYGQSISMSEVFLGTKSEPFVYTQTWGGQEYVDGNLRHSFTLTTPMDITISHCESTVSYTSAYLSNLMEGIFISSADEPSDCTNSGLASFKGTNLPAGNYSLNSSWPIGNGEVTLTIRGSKDPIIPIEPLGPIGNKMSNAIDLGSQSSLFMYFNTQNTNGFTNEYEGQSTNDVFYKFTLTASMSITISHCNSGLTDTYIHLLNENGERIRYSDGSNDAIICNAGQAYMSINVLPPGTYYVVSEGKNQNGNIKTTIGGDLSSNHLIGNNMSNAIDLGSQSSRFLYSDMQNTNKFTNEYEGQSANDVFYKFTLTTPLEISIHHCGSEIADTYIHLLNENGEPIRYTIGNDDDDNTSSNNDVTIICDDVARACLLANVLFPGTYYVVSEGKNQNGNINTTISGEIPFSGPMNYYPAEDRMVNAIDLGSQSSGFIYSNTQNTNEFTDGYGLVTNDVFYTFTLTTEMDITISHCGSELGDTSIYLLDANGNAIDHRIIPGICGNSGQAYLEKPNLPAGIYYVISEGKHVNGSIITRIEGEKYVAPDIDIIPNIDVSQNYILTTTLTAGISEINRAKVNNSLKTVQYFDGIGRPIEAIQMNASPNKNDIITYQEFDDYGRESMSWLPTVAQNNNGAFVPYSEFVSKSLGTYNNDSKTFSKIVYEESPLNRAIEQYEPGQDWHSREKAARISYMINDETNPCRLYITTDNNLLVSMIRSTSSSYYSNGQLYVTQSTDEDGKISYEFKDKLGQVVLTRQMDGTVPYDTYYLYDCYGNLRIVLPPLAADGLDAGIWGEDNPYLQQYAYLYKYDERNRCIAKKLPGAEWVYYIYDNADRLIFSQDGVQRSRSEWTFNIYDALGRVVLTGTCNNTLDYLEQLDTNVTGVWTNATGNYKGYTVNGTSLVNANLLTVNYYDSYDFMGKNNIPGSTHSSYKFDDLSEFSSRYATSEMGLQTGSLTALEESGNVKFLTNTMYYDYRGRLIQTHSDNHLTNGIDKNYVNYNFTGQPVHTQHVHSAEGKPTLTEYGDFTYDHTGRLLKTEHQLKYNDVLSDKVTLAECTYDELGRLQNKFLHGNNADPIRYQYNVRSWIEDITSNNFAEGLFYNTIAGNMTPLYNGNITTMVWRAGMEGLRGYNFVYDGLNRLTEANYGENILMTTNPGRFTERVTEYDKHGNIKGIERYGKTSASQYGLVDNLSFGYSGNRMKYVNDLASVSSTGQSFHFINGDNSIGDEYQYNANGNLVKDSNKNITNIQYNLLNLPTRVELSGNRSATYLYDAAGVKRKVTHLEGLTGTSTDYCGNVIYENGQLDKILTGEGYITLSGTTPTYHYHLKDHLGNVRVVQHQNGSTIEQINHYYPFGGLFDQTAEDAQRYKYNGKELDRIYGIDLYDYSARYMDGALGRFTTMDPLAEKYYSISPYAYCANNPVRFVDLKGDSLSVSQDILDDYVLNESFYAFASSAAGRAFLAQFASKGQTLYGYTFKKDGKYHKKGMNLNYITFDGNSNQRGETGYSADGQITIGINSLRKVDAQDGNYYEWSAYPQMSDPKKGAIMSRTITIFHESLIHADLYAKDYVDDGVFNYSNISKKIIEHNKGKTNAFKYYHHHAVYYNDYSMNWPGGAYTGVVELNKRLGTGYNSSMLKKMLWNYSYGGKL